MRFAFAALAFFSTVARAASPTVAVMPFRDLARPDSAVGEAIRETVTTDLKQLGAVRVVERGNLDRVLAEQHIQAVSDVDPQTAARLGKLLGATHIVAGAYQQSGAQVRLTARFIKVETGEVVGTAKVDGKAVDLLRLQDRVTAELLRSTGLAAHARRFVERSRPDVQPRVMELYGQSLVAQNDDQRRKYLVMAVDQDHSFTYAVDDLAALETRMAKYQAQADAAAEKALIDLRAQIANETDPNKKALLVNQLLTGFVTRHRYKQLVKEARAVLSEPPIPIGMSDTHDIASFYIVTADAALRDRDALLRDGERFLREHPASPYFSSVKVQMDVAIRQKREEEERRAELPKAIADIPPRLKWDLCHVASIYRSKHAQTEAQRLYRACLQVGHSSMRKTDTLKSLIWIDLDLADWQSARRDLAALEKEDPVEYRREKMTVEQAIPTD